MQADLTSSTEVARHAVYDPSIASFDGDLERTLGRVPAGDLFAIDTAGDGELGLRIYVDEALPAELERRLARKTPDALLRVPSGRVYVAGLEHVGRERDVGAASITVPPGNYLVDAYELDFSWEKDIQPALEQELGDAYRREQRAGRFGGVMFFGGLAATLIGLVAWRPGVLVAGIAALVLAVLALKLLLPGRDYEAKKAAIAQRFPDLVLVLRRLGVDADLAAYRGVVLRTAD